MVAPLAFVLGDLDLIRPLSRAGIRCAAALAKDDPARFSRFVRQTLEPLDNWSDAEAFVDRLLAWGRDQPVPPVLFYQTDGDLLMVSRHRHALSSEFRLVLPDADLVEDLVDKARFAALAERLALPVPRSRRLTPGTGAGADDLSFPVVVKPLSRRSLVELRTEGKAVLVQDRSELRRLRQILDGRDIDLLAQELVPGPESCIESYHAYIDARDTVAAEFTGRKIRTYPREFGHTTALEITADADVMSAGRSVLSALSFRGIAKVDFKRDAAGRLHLLEVNPRFSLWHAAGAVAGVNIPAFVYADATGRPRPARADVRHGVTWVSPEKDYYSMRAGEQRPGVWLRTLVGSSVRSGVDWDDPGPLLRGLLWPRLRRRALGNVSRGR